MAREFSKRAARKSFIRRDDTKEFWMRGHDARTGIVKAAKLLSENIVVRINGKGQIINGLEKPRRSRRVLGPIPEGAYVSVRVEQLPPVIVHSTNAEFVLEVDVLSDGLRTSTLNSMAELSRFLSAVRSEALSGSALGAAHKGPYPPKKPTRPRPRPTDTNE